MNTNGMGQGSLYLPGEHMTKTALAVEALRAAILRGEIAQDQPLTVGRIAQQLGMSPTPVREAIRTLQAEGLIRHQAHHSVSVMRYTAKDLRDIFELRAQLESQAIRLAVPRLSDSDIAQLDNLQRQMHDAAAEADANKLNRLNADWHLLIYSAADNRVLLDLVQHLWKKFMFEVNWIQPGHAPRSLQQHDKLLEAIHARDADMASELMSAHIQSGQESALHAYASRERASDDASSKGE